MRCSKCGAEMPEGARFCGMCGGKLAEGRAPLENVKTAFKLRNYEEALEHCD